MAKMKKIEFKETMRSRKGLVGFREYRALVASYKRKWLSGCLPAGGRTTVRLKVWDLKDKGFRYEITACPRTEQEHGQYVTEGTLPANAFDVKSRLEGIAMECLLKALREDIKKSSEAAIEVQRILRDQYGYVNGKLPAGKRVPAHNEFPDALTPDGDIDMRKICGCPDAKTLSDCESGCGKYYSCQNVAIANDILAEMDGSK